MMNMLKLSAQEQLALQLFLDICPQWVDIISKQIEFSRIQRNETDSNYTILFHCCSCVNPIYVSAKMPIEVILGDVTILTETALKRICNYNITNTNNIFCTEHTAIAIRVYFNDGVLSELEMYSLSGKPFDFSQMIRKQRTYIIHDSALYAEIIKQHPEAPQADRKA